MGLFIADSGIHYRIAQLSEKLRAHLIRIDGLPFLQALFLPDFRKLGLYFLGLLQGLDRSVTVSVASVLESLRPVFVKGVVAFILRSNQRFLVSLTRI